jgi:hypothetical protein
MECRCASSAGKLRNCLERGNAIKLGLERRDAELVDGCGVHATRSIRRRSSARWRYVRGRRGGSRLLQNLLQVQAVQLIELVKRP